jgi:hypothetical protein
MASKKANICRCNNLYTDGMCGLVSDLNTRMKTRQELCFDKSSFQNFTFACSEISHSIASTLRLWTDWSLKLRGSVAYAAARAACCDVVMTNLFSV